MYSRKANIFAIIWGNDLAHGVTLLKHLAVKIRFHIKVKLNVKKFIVCLSNLFEKWTTLHVYCTVKMYTRNIPEPPYNITNCVK